MRFRAGGTEIMNVKPVGVAILGTAASGAPLVTIENNSGSTATSYGLLVKGGGNSSSGKTFEVRDDSGNTDLIVKGDGNVGIGTSTTIEGRVDVKMNMASINWTEGNWSEVWDSAGTPGTYFDDAVFHIDTERAGGATGGIVGLAFSPGWQGHQNWGIYSFNTGGGSYSSGDLAFVSQIDNGTITERMRITSVGNVGIGTDTPQDKVQVHGGDIKITHATGGTFRGLILGATEADANDYSSLMWQATSGELRLSANPASFGGFMSFHSNASEAMRIQSNRNVLIGTTGATNTRLKVVQNVASEWACQITNTAAGAYGLAIDTSANTGVYSLGVYTNTGTGMFVKNNGRVGIGTTAPSYPLVVSNGGAGGIEFVPAASTGMQEILSYNRSSSAYEKLRFSTSEVQFYMTSERMRITSTGVVEIGSSVAQSIAKLDVRVNGSAIEFGHTNNNDWYFGTVGTYGSAGNPFISFACWGELSANTFTTKGAKANIIKNETDGSLSFNQITSINSTGQTPTERMRIDSSGNVGIGDTSTPNKLSVKDTGNLTCRYTGGSTFSLYQNNTDGTVIFSQDHGDTASENRFIWQTGGGVEQMRIDTSNTSLLTVAGGIQLGNGGGGGYLKYNTGNLYIQGTSNIVATFESTGNVGIGNTSPSSLLNVGTSSNTEITIGDASANAQGRLRFLTSNNQKNFQIGFNYNIAGGLEFTRSTAVGGSTFTTPDVAITSAGNVGIGTTAVPTNGWIATGGGWKMLQIGQSSQIAAYGTDDEIAICQNTYLNTSGVFQAITSNVAGSSIILVDGVINFKNATTSGTAQTTTTRMRINSTGNVGIGTTADNDINEGKLYVNGTLGLDATSEIKYGKNAGGPYLNIRSKDSSTSACGIRIHSPSGSPGYLYGEGSSGSNAYIGILDGDGAWGYQIRTDTSHTWMINNSNQMHLTTTGLGIGTTSPTKKLTVDAGSTSGDGINITGSSSPAIHINETSGTVNSSFQNDGAASYLGTSTSHNLILRTAGTTRFEISSAGKCAINHAVSNRSLVIGGALDVQGTLYKTSGSFAIDHPLESKKDTHKLIHSFIEGPKADNIYRGKAQLKDGSVVVNLDTVSQMTEGTFILLNRDVQCFTSNESDWDPVKGTIEGNLLTISCKNASSNAMISWMVVGERQDKEIKESELTDDNGKVIVEPTIEEFEK